MKVDKRDSLLYRVLEAMRHSSDPLVRAELQGIGESLLGEYEDLKARVVAAQITKLAEVR